MTGGGSFLTPPHEPTVRTGVGDPCRDLADPTFTTTCGELRLRSATGVWLNEQSNNAGPDNGCFLERLVVWVPTAAGWNLTLRASNEPNCSPFTNVTASSTDLAHDGSQKLLIEFFTQASGKRPRFVDVAEATGEVVIHRDIGDHGWDEGNPSGGLDTWTDLGSGRFRLDRIRYEAGRWHISASEVTSSEPQPTSCGAPC